MSDFWARRKAAVAKEAKADLVAVEAAEVAEAEAKLAERTDEDLLEEAKLPAPEELDSAEAVREFLASALPQRLKTRALRRLWTLNPVLANLDGLVDYGQDFTDSAMVIENLQTAYQVGKGMLAHIEEMARQDEAARMAEAEGVAEGPEGPEDAAEEASAEASAAEAAPENLPDSRPEPAPEPATHPEPVRTASLPADHAPDDTLPAPRPARRMQFHFEERA